VDLGGSIELPLTTSKAVVLPLDDPRPVRIYFLGLHSFLAGIGPLMGFAGFDGATTLSLHFAIIVHLLILFVCYNRTAEVASASIF
jgi:hypothetical protein